MCCSSDMAAAALRGRSRPGTSVGQNGRRAADLVSPPARRPRRRRSRPARGHRRAPHRHPRRARAARERHRRGVRGARRRARATSSCSRCPNCVEFLAAMIASWKVGATPTPVSSRLPKRELDGIIELAAPALIVGVDPADHPGVDVPAARLDAGARAARRARGAPRHRVGSVEGHDVGRQHRSPEADPQHRARADRSRREAAADDDAERHD